MTNKILLFVQLNFFTCLFSRYDSYVFMLRLGIETKFEAMEKLESRKSSKSRGLLPLGNTYGVKFKVVLSTSKNS